MKLMTYKVSGPDSSSFLQGLLTCDTRSLDKTPLIAACCNQKGRIIANFWIQQENDNFYLTLPKSMGDILKNHLQKYVFRSKVVFESLEQPVFDNEDAIWILPETTEQFTPQMIDLQKHGGVSFKKGCYLGQEIIARTEHLGQLKRHLYQIAIDTTVNIGDPINNAEQQKMGTIVAINNDTVFAVIEDRAIDQPLLIHDMEIKIMTEYQPILDYWFNDVNENVEKLEERNALWWAKNPETDQHILQHFSNLHQQAVQQQYQHWTRTPKGRLAAVILLDQFSRNMFRNDARAFAQDSQALNIALEGIERGEDQQLEPLERAFLYMPLEHAEDLSLQNRCIDLFEKLSNEAPHNLKDYLLFMLDYAKKHQKIIKQFGRFPHRNSILSRQSTEEEIEFLKQPDSSF